MRYVIAAPIKGTLLQKIDAYKGLHKEKIAQETKLPTHCTLYAAELCRDVEERVVREMEIIVKSQLELKLDCKELALFDSNALVLKLKKSSDMQLLHDRICFALKKYIWAIDAKDKNKKEAARIKKYGSLYSGPNYRPHITLFHPNDSEIKMSDYFQGEQTKLESVAVWQKKQDWKLLTEITVAK